MRNQLFEFELYRINLVQAELTLFEQMNKMLKSDADIIEVLRHAVKPDFKAVFSGPKNTFEWVLRDFTHYPHQYKNGGDVYGVTIAKSIIESAGETVTDTGIENGISELAPPLAETCRLFFHMNRHLMAIEYCSAVINSRWLQALEEILMAAARDLQFSGWIEFEPIPRHEEIMEAFSSFQRLTRLRVLLRLPNPEFSRYAQRLFNEMEEGSIREYLQDMKNPRGLNSTEGKLPHASTEIAAAGYKRGDVTLEGIRDGKREVVRTGKKAARGRIEELRSYVRGMKDVTNTKEAQKVTTAILAEIDRIAPPPKRD